MDIKTKEKLEKGGWQVGSTQDFLGLSNEEMQLIELRIALGKMLREKREEKGYTQTVFAKEIGTSQSRIAKMESGDSSVTVDLILKSLFHFVHSQDVCNYVLSYIYSSSP